MNTKTYIKLAEPQDAAIIKQLVNEMYRNEYEVRDHCKIAQAIALHNEVYTLCFENGVAIGFAGANMNSTEYAQYSSQTKVVLEYVYVKKEKRNLFVAFLLIKKLLQEIAKTSQRAILEVQTFNKQRFLHYAISDKNIIATQHHENFDDQILLIEDVKKVSQLTLPQFVEKAKKYLTDIL